MSPNDAARYLKKLSLFTGLPEEVLAELASKLERRAVVKDESLFTAGAPGDAAYIIRYGWLKVHITGARGEELVLNQCGPGEVVGEMALIDGQPRSAAVTALSPAELFVFKRDDFLTVLEQYPLLALDVMRNFSNRLRFANTYLQKAVEWSQQIADGDYSFALNQIQAIQSTIIDSRKPDEARADELLSAFFRLVKGVKEREDALREQLREFHIQIDTARQQKAIDEVVYSTFFGRIKDSVPRAKRHHPETDES
jgi:CRP-like cAMP-binding protein